MTREAVEMLIVLLGELADKLNSARCYAEASEIVDCATRISEYLRGRS